MASIIDEFNVFRGVDPYLKNEIKTFHVMKSVIIEGNAGYFVTKSDQVYGAGMNYGGNRAENSDQGVHFRAQLIPELCDKNICEFYLFHENRGCFAWSTSSEIYAWGTNYSQMEMKDSDEPANYLIPRRMSFFSDKNIIKITTFFLNYFALSSNGKVYKFGHEYWANPNNSLLPELIFDPSKNVLENSIKGILSSIEGQNLMSTKGFMYFYCTCIDSYYKPGIHNIPKFYQNGDQIVPKKIQVAMLYIFVLTEQGTVYYSKSTEFSQMNLLKLETSLIILDIFRDDNQLLCQTNQGVYVFQLGKEFIKAKHMNFFDYYLEEYQATTSSITIDQAGFITTNELILNTNKGNDQYYNEVTSYIYDNQGKFTRQFKEIKYLGSGSFGKVLLVNTLDEFDKQYAIKKIWLDIEDDKNKLFKEIRFMSKMDSNFIPQIVNAWIEKRSQTFAFIQMEYCQASLDKLIQVKPYAFDRKPDQPMNSMEFFISCEMLYELTECLGYFHSFERSYFNQAHIMPFENTSETQVLIHRDVKPENVLVTNGTQGRFLKLSDLGLLKIFDGLTPSSKAGTKDYMAPEVEHGDPYDSKADIYSLGKIGLELFNIDLTSLDHISKKSYGKFNFSKLFELLIQMIDMNPGERPNCKEILENLQQINNRAKINRESHQDQLSKLEKFETKFFYEFYLAKLDQEPIIQSHLSNIEPDALKLQDTQDNNLNEESLDKIMKKFQAITQDVIYKIPPIINQGSGDDPATSTGPLVSRILDFAIDLVPTLLDEIFNELAGCFYLSSKIILANENKIEAILKEHANIVIMVKQIVSRLKHDLISVERMNGWRNYVQDIPEISLLKPGIKDEDQDLPHISNKFETIKVYSGNSALFDAISFTLFRSMEYSRMLRLMTFVKYFENLERFEKYTSLIGENYNLSLLKIGASDENVIKLQDKLKIRDLSIKNENSVILAINLVISRRLNIFPSSFNECHTYSINELSCSLHGELVHGNPVNIYMADNEIYSLEPKNLQDVININSSCISIPGDHFKIFEDLKDQVESNFQPLIDTIKGGFVSWMPNHEYTQGDPSTWPGIFNVKPESLPWNNPNQGSNYQDYTEPNNTDIEGIKSFYNSIKDNVLGPTESTLDEIFIMLISCFNLDGDKIVQSDQLINEILKVHDKFITSMRNFIKHMNICGFNQDRLDVLLNNQVNPSDIENLPEISSTFDVTKVFRGNSAIFNAISFSLFKTAEYSRIIRFLTFINYFENRTCLDTYCDLIGENYTLTLLKIAASDEVVSDYQETLNITNLILSNEQSAILAIHSIVARKINMLTGYFDEYKQYTINELGDIVSEDPVWLCSYSKGILVVEPRNKKGICSVVELIPGQSHRNLFKDFKFKIKSHTLPSMEETLGNLFNNIFIDDSNEQNYNQANYSEDDELD